MTKHTVQIIIELPKEHRTYEAAEEAANKEAKSLAREYPGAHIETHIWEV